MGLSFARKHSSISVPRPPPGLDAGQDLFMTTVLEIRKHADATGHVHVCGPNVSAVMTDIRCQS